MSRNAQRIILSKKKKKKKNVDLGWIWGFHKNDFITPSSSDPYAPDSY